MLDVIADTAPGRRHGDRRALGPPRRAGPGPDAGPARRVGSSSCTSRTTGSAPCRRPRWSCSPRGTSPAFMGAFRDLVQFAEVGQGTLDWTGDRRAVARERRRVPVRRAGRHLRSRPVRVARDVPRPPRLARVRRTSSERTGAASRAFSPPDPRVTIRAAGALFSVGRTTLHGQEMGRMAIFEADRNRTVPPAQDHVRLVYHYRDGHDFVTDAMLRTEAHGVHAAAARGAGGRRALRGVVRVHRDASRLTRPVVRPRDGARSRGGSGAAGPLTGAARRSRPSPSPRPCRPAGRPARRRRPPSSADHAVAPVRTSRVDERRIPRGALEGRARSDRR